MLLTIRVPSSITPGMNFGDDKMWSIIEGRMSKPPCTPSRSFRMSVLSSILALLNRMLSMAGKDSQINYTIRDNSLVLHGYSMPVCLCFFNLILYVLSTIF